MLEMMIKRKEMIENFKKYLKNINESIKAVLKDFEVFLFGSVIEGNLVAASDIDILIIAEVPKNHLKRAEIIAKIEEKARLPFVHPFEFHILTNEELKTWKNIYDLKYEKISSYMQE